MCRWAGQQDRPVPPSTSPLTLGRCSREPHTQVWREESPNPVVEPGSCKAPSDVKSATVGLPLTSPDPLPPAAAPYSVPQASRPRSSESDHSPWHCTPPCQAWATWPVTRGGEHGVLGLKGLRCDHGFTRERHANQKGGQPIGDPSAVRQRTLTDELNWRPRARLRLQVQGGIASPH